MLPVQVSLNSYWNYLSSEMYRTEYDLYVRNLSSPGQVFSFQAIASFVGIGVFPEIAFFCAFQSWMDGRNLKSLT